MDHLHQTTKQIFKNVWLVTFFSQLVVGSVLVVLLSSEILTPMQVAILVIIAWGLIALLAAFRAQHSAKIPLEAVGRAILHVSPSQHGVAAPKLETLSIGRAYVTDMVNQIQELAHIQTDQILVSQQTDTALSTSILRHLPLSLFALNSKQMVASASDIALSYSGVDAEKIIGQPLYDLIDLEFSSELTLDAWMTDCQQNKATDTTYWRRVRVRSKANPDLQKQCDIAGSYNRAGANGVEFIITLFDHTEEYDQDDQSINFVALAVHELRTPLTIMRGYIEALQDNLVDSADPQTRQYMNRLHSSAERLSSFINNILNVSRIQENQLTVNIAEEDWSEVIAHACQDMDVQAGAHDKIITQRIDQNLPTVGVDRTTIHEVLCNLLENAIKYSGKSDKIVVSARMTKDGLVETSVKDSGVGIPAAVLPTLFEKFHRNHRNRSQISGTGLGLYISKAIIDAHDGSIWVNSTEGQGSTFSFTVKPYSLLAAETKTSDNDAMTRTAHGWIKNHSMYRK